MSNKTFKIVSASICCLALAVGAIFTGIAISNISNASTNSNVWGGTAYPNYFTQNAHLGSSESTPYVIDTPEKLAGLAALVNSGSSVVQGKYFKQTKNIILDSNYENYLNWDETAGATYFWTPIGTEANMFNGNYDGNNLTIQGVYIWSTLINNSGVFGVVDFATIKNLIIDHSYIKTTKANTSALVGSAGYSTIENCHIKNSTVAGNSYTAGIVGNASQCEINDCSNGANISNTAGFTAGIAGNSFMTWFRRCYNTGSISSTSTNIGDIGGIVGSLTYGYIRSSYNLGDIYNTTANRGGIGGIAGNMEEATIYSSFNKGLITGSKYVGGITGGAASSNRIYNCYNTNDVTGTYYVGGIVGYLDSGSTVATVSNCYSVGQVSADSYGGKIAGHSYPRPIMYSYYLDIIGGPDGNGPAEYHSTCIAFSAPGTLVTAQFGTTDLKDALNAWRESSAGGNNSADYLEWITTQEDPYPHFNIKVDDGEEPPTDPEPDDSCLCPCSACVAERARNH